MSSIAVFVRILRCGVGNLRRVVVLSLSPLIVHLKVFNSIFLASLISSSLRQRPTFNPTLVFDVHTTVDSACNANDLESRDCI